MNDADIEREIQDKGLTAPRVKPADIEANIVSDHYFTAADGVDGAGLDALRNERPDEELVITALVADVSPAGTPMETLGLLTFCILTLKNGFTVTGESACASPENFDAEIGRKIARQNAVDKVWSLMGADGLRAEEQARRYLTMAYYRKIPVVIEAAQWFKDGDHPAVFTHESGGQVWVNGQSYVETLEGRHLVTPGDWIIKGVKGEMYPCKDEIFRLTYVEAWPDMTKPLLAVGFERAFVGIAQRCGQPDLAVYDYDKAVATLVKEAGMPINDAVDFLETNALGAWMGEGSPLWLMKMPLDAALESWAFEE